MSKIIIVCAALIAICSSGFSENFQASEKSAIEKVLRDQAGAWNRGDLEGFMAGYWKSPELTFFSGAHEYKGWQAALDRYKSNYQSAGKEINKLEFANLRVEMLKTEAAFVRKKFHLTRSDGKTPHGLFTLILRKVPEGWKIVHDHSAGE